MRAAPRPGRRGRPRAPARPRIRAARGRSSSSSPGSRRSARRGSPARPSRCRSRAGGRRAAGRAACRPARASPAAPPRGSPPARGTRRRSRPAARRGTTRTARCRGRSGRRCSRRAPARVFRGTSRPPAAAGRAAGGRDGASDRGRQFAGADPHQRDQIVGRPEPVDVALAEPDAAAQRPPVGARVTDLDPGAELRSGRPEGELPPALGHLDPPAANSRQRAEQEPPRQRLAHGRAPGAGTGRAPPLVRLLSAP